MARCKRTTNLEVHHINRSAGNPLSNALVLCRTCHEATGTFGKPITTSPPDFSEATKEAAKKRAGYQCQCTETTKDCH